MVEWVNAVLWIKQLNGWDLVSKLNLTPGGVCRSGHRKASRFFIIFTNNVFLFVQAAKICQQKFSKIYGECEVYRKANLQCVTIIEEVIQIIKESLHLGAHIDFFFSFLGFWIFNLFIWDCKYLCLINTRNLVPFIILFHLALVYFMKFLWFSFIV